jgi:phosphopantetheine adenylyltransferase
MTTLRTAAQQALEVLVRASSYYDTYAEIAALEAALAEPVQEPYWYATPDGKYLSSNEVREWMDPKTKALHLEPPQWRKEELIPLYTHPPK